MNTMPNTQPSLRRSILQIAVPVSLQTLLQSSLAVIDQIMVGQLGTDSIAGVGLGSTFPALFVTTLMAVGASASIMISQYVGAKDKGGVRAAFCANNLLAVLVMLAFLLPSALFPTQILRFYTTDATVAAVGAGYMRIVSIGYLPLMLTTMLSALLRNIGYVKSPVVAGGISVFVNTALNYLLIFGNFGAPKLGANGTAIATTAARVLEFAIVFVLFLRAQRRTDYRVALWQRLPAGFLGKTVAIAAPMMLNEFLWGFGNNVYASIYGHIGAAAMAAMTLTNPVQGLSVGLFSGLSTAAGILVGNKLGSGDNEGAFAMSRRMMRVCILGSVAAGAVLCLLAAPYTMLFQVTDATRQATVRILYVFSGFLFVKVSNMVLAGGILRSGGKTGYTLAIDLFGTWGVGVPLGLLTGMALHLPIHWVYFWITVEEAVRLMLGFIVFRSRRWMRRLTA